jgi:membrane-associated phospholipid phosphatase
MKCVAAIAVLVALSTPLLSRADEPPPAGTPAPEVSPPASPADQAVPVRYDLAVDGTIAAAASTLWILSETVGKSYLAPRTCRVCGSDSSHTMETVNGVDRTVRNHLVWDNTNSANTLSSAIAFGVMPAAAFLTEVLSVQHYGNYALAGPDLLLLVETVSLAAVLNQILKFSVGRERPFVHVLDESLKPMTAQPSDNNLSFPGGHTSFTMSMAVGAGTIAWLRGYRAAPWIWAIGIPLSLFVGYLRIAADMHYFTDILSGAAMGAAFGFCVPYFFHRWQPKEPGGPGLVPAANGVAIRF